MSYSILLLIPITILIVYLFLIFSFLAYTDDWNFIAEMKTVSRYLLNFVLAFYLLVSATYSTKFLVHKIGEYKNNRIRVEQLIKKGLAFETLQELMAVMEAEREAQEELRRQELERKFQSERREA